MFSVLKNLIRIIVYFTPLDLKSITSSHLYFLRVLYFFFFFFCDYVSITVKIIATQIKRKQGKTTNKTRQIMCQDGKK